VAGFKSGFVPQSGYAGTTHPAATGYALVGRMGKCCETCLGDRRRAFLRLESEVVLVAASLFAFLAMQPSEQSQPLLYWKFDEATGQRAQDASGHGQVGQTGAAWVKTTAGPALGIRRHV